jgi:hypothetical protein
MIDRIIWLALSFGGALFYFWLLFRAVGDLRFRKGDPGSPRSAVLLAWQRVAFDSVLGMVMLFDCLLAWLSLQPGYGGLVVDGLILGKASLVVLGLYLFWNRNETAKAGKVEIRRGNYGRRTTNILQRRADPDPVGPDTHQSGDGSDGGAGTRRI